MLRTILAAALSLFLSTAASAATINVPIGGDLQGAVNAAQPGDTVVLAMGGRWVGNFVLPPKSGPVTLTTSGGLASGRTSPSDAGLMPTIISGNGMTSLTVGSNWTVDGIRSEENPGGFGNVVELAGDNITYTRYLINVPDPVQQRRFIYAGGHNITVSDGYCGGIVYTQGDAQCVAILSGSGPYAILNNYLEASGENVLIGGGDPVSCNEIPSNILIENNFMTKRLSWKVTHKGSVKNILELKDAHGVIIRGNTFERNWSDAQSGRAIVFTPRNQDGTMPCQSVENVLFENNIVRDVEVGFNISGYDDINESLQTECVVIRNNDITTNLGAGFLLQSEIGSLEISNNRTTVPTGQPEMILASEAMITVNGIRRATTYAVREFYYFANVTNGYIHGALGHNQAALDIYTIDTFNVPMVTCSAGPDPTPTPTPDYQAQIDALKAALAATEAKLQALIDYLDAIPNATKIMQVVNYLRGVK